MGVFGGIILGFFITGVALILFPIIFPKLFFTLLGKLFDALEDDSVNADW